MSFVQTVASELFGLFVDDGSLAIGILVLVAAIAGLQYAGVIAPAITGVAVFAGLVLLLLENVLRHARSRQ